MKLVELTSTEGLLFEAKRALLNETLLGYLSQTLAHLKSKEPAEVFDEKDPLVDLDRLATILAGVRVLANPKYREVLTPDDVGFNPNSAKMLYRTLDDVTKDGKDPKHLISSFNALKAIAPSMYHKTRDHLEKLKSDDDAERQAEINKLETLTQQIGLMVAKLKQIVNGPSLVKAPAKPLPGV